MSKQLNIDETHESDLNVNIVANGQQYLKHLQDVQPTDITFEVENGVQYVQPVPNTMTINRFPSQAAFDSQTSNLAWSDVSVIYEDNDFIDKDNMFVYFYDYDGKVLYKYNINGFFVIDELPPLPDHSNINKISDGWNWTLQEIKDYLNDCPSNINVGLNMHNGINPELGSSRIRFYNHEGDILYDYSAAQFLALSALPALPDLSSINRVADGWNWTLSEITQYLYDVDGDVNVGYTMSVGNNPSVGSSKVRFYDYDDTLLHEYTAAQFLALSALPALPDRTSENLTSEEWNWTLSEITGYLNAVDGDVNVGVTYHTTDNKTHITCKPTETFPYAYICLVPTDANAVTVDWGDGTTNTWTTANFQETKSHTYTGVTDSSVYDIAISCSSGTYTFQTYITGSEVNNKNCVYTDVKLSNKVTNFMSIFQYCYSLKTVTIPNTITSYNNYCFQYCYSLKSITIPRSFSYLFYGSFMYCVNMQHACIPNTIIDLYNYCFSGCFSLQSITIPNGITHIADSLFSQCESLKSITIPSSVTSLGFSCFQGCGSLQSINIQNTVTSIGNGCFNTCFSLQVITIPKGITILGDGCFSQCYSLVSICIPCDITSFGESCFSNCLNLTSITIPNNIAFLNQYCFSSCSSLQSITIPNSVTGFGTSCFSYCESLKSINIPRSITSISDHCFNMCRNLRTLTIPNSVTVLNSYCFYYTSVLQSINIPSSVTSFGSGCFSNCAAQSITIPRGITSIGDYCFQYCSHMRTITIPSSVTDIGNYCFSSCNALESMYVKPSTPPILPSSEALPQQYIENLVIYVPTESLATYQNATNWSEHSSRIKAYNIFVKDTQLASSVVSKTLIINNIPSSSLIDENICVLVDEKTYTNDINFYDYDGTLLYSYSSDEFLSMTSLPGIPDRTYMNLTCDGWNWTLADIKSQINNVGGVVNVGAMYHTTDGKTYITCKPTSAYPKAYICLTPTVANDVTVDWGDGATDTWVNVSPSTTKSHTYADADGIKEYTITISCSSGTYSFQTYITGEEYRNKKCVYTDVKLSNKITSLGDEYDRYCFYECRSLKSIIIPNTITSLRDYCFGFCNSLKSIIIPNSVTSLASICFGSCYSLKVASIPYGVTIMYNYCFEDCNSLESITIPDNVTRIGHGCFRNCDSLESIAIPSNLTGLEDYVFEHCISLKSVTIPSNITSLGSGCFSGCYFLQDITIPSSVTSIGGSCFNQCYSLKSITIPNGIITLSGFSNCYSLRSITIPNSVTTLNDYCFSGCWSLQSINIPNSVTSFGSGCFYGCHSLRNITIPNSVTSIGRQCFGNCHSLRSITIPNSVTKFDVSWCFYNCYSLESITIPSSITSFGDYSDVFDYSFNQCYSLKSITIPNGVTRLGNNCFASCGSLKEINIPSSVTTIGANCFYNCYSLRNITIPNGVTSLGEHCFQYCHSLQTINIPNSVTTLNDCCFESCDCLQNITISNGVTSIGRECFLYNQSLESITFPSSVTTIGANCLYYCYDLKKVYMEPTTPPAFESAGIENNPNLVIYVPSGTLSAYQSATNWSNYASKMREM